MVFDAEKSVLVAEIIIDTSFRMIDNKREMSVDSLVYIPVDIFKLTQTKSKHLSCR
jgi:hypothetical protein